MKHYFNLALVILFLIYGCGRSGKEVQKEIIIFHAGSLSVPFRELKSEYEKLNPDVDILLEAAGSLVCARKITELKKPCDIIASADYFVINEMLIPDYTGWSVRFATNEIVIAYNERSKFSSGIDSSNWMDILQRPEVIYARSDPDQDPCGYRTIFSLMLAEKYYKRKGLASMLKEKNKDFIRPKEVDLVALLETNAIDYMFQYKSVAIQHGFKYIELPREINLSDSSKKDIYGSVYVDVTGSKPGSTLKVRGDFINYSISVLDKAPHRDEALDFLSFILGGKGKEIFIKNGQDPLDPLVSGQPEMVPVKLRKYFARQ